MKNIKKERNKEIEKDELIYDDISKKIFESRKKKDKVNEKIEEIRNNEKYTELNLKFNPNFPYSSCASYLSSCFIEKEWLYESLKKEWVTDVNGYVENADNDTKMQWLHLALNSKKACCICDAHIAIFVNCS